MAAVGGGGITIRTLVASSFRHRRRCTLMRERCSALCLCTRSRRGRGARHGSRCSSAPGAPAGAISSRTAPRRSASRPIRRCWCSRRPRPPSLPPSMRRRRPRRPAPAAQPRQAHTRAPVASAVEAVAQAALEPGAATATAHAPVTSADRVIAAVPRFRASTAPSTLTAYASSATSPAIAPASARSALPASHPIMARASAVASRAIMLASVPTHRRRRSRRRKRRRRLVAQAPLRSRPRLCHPALINPLWSDMCVCVCLRGGRAVRRYHGAVGCVIPGRPLPSRPTHNPGHTPTSSSTRLYTCPSFSSTPKHGTVLGDTVASTRPHSSSCRRAGPRHARLPGSHARPGPSLRHCSVHGSGGGTPSCHARLLPHPLIFPGLLHRTHLPTLPPPI